MKKMYRLIVWMAICILLPTEIFAQVGAACGGKVQRRIMLIGDSWAHFAWIYRSIGESLKANGFADINEDGTRTALISTQAEFWDTPEGLQIIQDRIGQLPDADIFILFIGGNDVMWKWRRGKPFEDLLPYADAMMAHTDNIIDAVLAVRPNAQVILASYDYPNFAETMVGNEWNPYYDQWVKFGFAPPIEINLGLQFFEEYRANWPKYNQSSNVRFINNIGVAQYYGGYPDSTVFEPYVPFAPKTVSLPNGDPRYPTSPRYMGLNGYDAYHFNDVGYKFIGDNMMRQFIGEYLRKDKTKTFKSTGGNEEGFISRSGFPGTGEIRIGKSFNMDYAGIFSFNLSDIPEGAQIEKASIYITRKNLTGTAPLEGIFPGNVTIDMKAGFFGSSSAPESGDFNAPATVENAGCMVGSARGEEYKLRIDLTPEALAAINRTGLNQFRIKFNLPGSSNRMLHFFNGDEEDEYNAPFMDVTYTSTSTGIQDKKTSLSMVMFPNPTSNNLSFEVPVELRKSGVQALVYNMMGSVVQSHNLFLAGVPTGNIKVKDLPAGSYILQLTDGEVVAGGNFVVQN
jgi:lysophospholipase L1-like esterase